MPTQNLVERIVSLPVLNPASGRPSRSFRFKGKLDLFEINDGRINDWKAVKSIERFIKQKTIGFQTELYAAALMAEGHDVREVAYRLIEIPSIKFCGKDKDLDSYVQRCVDWLLESPEHVVEHQLMLNPERVRRAQEWLWGQCKQILRNRQTGHWATSEHACFAWERACECMPLCETMAGGGDPEWLVGSMFKVRERAHPELGEAGDDLDVITYSSASLLSLCQMKYYWTEERRLERMGDDKGESLQIGRAMHTGLEVYQTDGHEAAMAAIEQYDQDHPAIGEEQAKKSDQIIGRAKAMTLVAAERWLK